MPTLIDLRRRVKSVKNTQQITKAMKTVSSAKLKKAQRIVLEGRPHWHNSPDLLARVVGWAGKESHPLFAVREEKKIHVIVITADKGLCGAFNSNLLAKALSFIEEKAGHSRVSLSLIGKKAVNFFKKYPYPVERAYAERVDKLTVRELNEMTRQVMQKFLFQETDAAYVAYNEFKSLLAPRITIAKLLPVTAKDEAAGREGILPDWEPASAVLLQTLVPRYIENQLSHFFFESQAAEQAARMMAMDNASKNAEDLIADQVLVLNKIRQANITKELLEIMTAVEALKETQ
jgi:F-type H+-transporting ATPase subunit gamma